MQRMQMNDRIEIITDAIAKFILRYA